MASIGCTSRSSVRIHILIVCYNTRMVIHTTTRPTTESDGQLNSITGIPTGSLKKKPKGENQVSVQWRFPLKPQGNNKRKNLFISLMIDKDVRFQSNSLINVSLSLYNLSFSSLSVTLDNEDVILRNVEQINDVFSCRKNQYYIGTMLIVYSSFEVSLVTESFVQSTKREIDLIKRYWIEKYSRQSAHKRKNAKNNC